MKTLLSGEKQGERGSAIIVYAFVATVILLTIGGVALLVSRSTNITGRRSNLIAAQQCAQAGVVVACNDLNTATTGGSGSVGSKLIGGANPYTLNTSLSTSGTNVYQRTIAAPFANQSVVAQIWLPSSSAATSAKITATATVGPVTQTATGNTIMAWGYPGAIISTSAGLTNATSVSKTSAQDGNVVINGDKSGPIIVYGGAGEAVMANGSVIYDTNYANPPSSAYSSNNWGTANQIPDYTAQGTSNSLFDFGRFIAVADLTPEPTNFNVNGNNHFTNVQSFINAAATHTNVAHALQGVIVVDVTTSDKSSGNMTSQNLPSGINVEGTLLFNFIGSGWDPTQEKIVVTASLNINPADLSHLVATNPATYTTGYPPTYTDNTKNPTNINITPRGYTNFVAGDDLPAEIYTIGVLDMHGNADISGVLYTPSYMEIENKGAGQTQYIRGSLIMGNGIYYENLQSATSIISFDPAAVNSLTTLGGEGKKIFLTYWQ